MSMKPQNPTHDARETPGNRPEWRPGAIAGLEQEGAIASEWGASDNNRRARFYRLTAAGRKQLQAETRNWEETAALIGRFFDVKAEDL